MAKRKNSSNKVAAPAQPGSPLQEWGRVAGACVLLVLAGAALWIVAPFDRWGAVLVMGLFASAFMRQPRGAMSAAMAGLAVVVVLALRSVAPGITAVTPALEWVLMPVLAASLAFAVSLVRLQGLSRNHIAWVLLAIVVLTLCVRGVGMIQQLGPGVDVEPPAEQYSFDPIMFDKVFYLMEGGSGFYAAYGDAFKQDARFDAPTPDLAGWRSPTTFWIWTLFANRWSTVMYAFVFLGALSSLGGFYIASRAFKDSVAAVVPAALMAPYYLFALQRWWFPELEFWATFVAVGSAVAIYSKRERLGFGLALLAGAMREWLLSALIAGVAQRLVSPKRMRALYWLAGAAVVAGGYIANAAIVRKYLISVGVQPQLGTTGRVGGGGPGFILYTARFCSDLMVHPFAVPWLVLACALVVASLMVVRGRNLYLPALLLAPLAGFMVFGSGQGPFGEIGWNDYYGAAYLPFVFILVAGLVDLPALVVKKKAAPQD